MKKILITLLIVVVLLIAGGLYAKNWYETGIAKSNSEDNSIVEFTIESGTSANTIGVNLYEQGLIADKLLWQIYIKLNQPELLADKYTLTKNLSIQEIVEILKVGQKDEVVWVTLQEGISMARTLKAFESAKGFTDLSLTELDKIMKQPDKYTFSAPVQDFLKKYKPAGKPLEGFIYPETYAFAKDASAQDVIEKILAEFISQVAELKIDQGKYDFYQALTLASIVESESISDDDREIIAGVFDNRLDDGMLLQSDATVNYAVGEGKTSASFEDLKIDSPYNTYKYTGLPPAPISSPRLQAIKVALNPMDTEYYFFMHAEGVPHYGKTLSDHEYNICKYLNKSC